ncbi:MAG: hypothetical protein WCK41_07150 [Actinomycetes bacterium]
MKIRIAGLAVLLVLLSACGSSTNSSTESESGSDTTIDVDQAAASACKQMDEVLAHTADGSDISGSDANAFLKAIDPVLKPNGSRTTRTDPVPQWKPLGLVLVPLLQAVTTHDTAAIADLTPQAQAICATIPAEAQSAAGYKPTGT